MQQCLNSVRNFLVVIVNIMYNELPLLNTFTIDDQLITRKLCREPKPLSKFQVCFCLGKLMSSFIRQ